MKCTPFHVRFGKMQIIRSAGTEVSIHVNGTLTGLKMRLGAAGEAYFFEDEVATGSASGTGSGSLVDLSKSTPALEGAVVSRSSPDKNGVLFLDRLEAAKKERRGFEPSEPPERDLNIPLRSISDGNLEVVQARDNMEWNWGKLPRVSSRDSLIMAEELRAELVAPTVPAVSAPVVKTKWEELGERIQQFWSKERDPKQIQSEIEISDCAHLLENVPEDQVQAIFESKKIDFESFNSNPSILFSPDLVVKIGNEIFPFSVAGPFLCSFIFFRRALDESVLNELEHQNPLLSPAILKKKVPTLQETPKQTSGGWFNYRKWMWSSASTLKEDVKEEEEDYLEEEDTAVAGSTSTTSKTASGDDNFLEDEEEEDATDNPLCPSQEQLQSLNLKPGANQVVFSVRTGLRGVQTLSCQLFLWDDHAPIVISDVDGTITRSDVPGQFLPYMGKDWSQKGVTELFSRIERNGYHILYLTARSIGQANSTRGFITGLHRDGHSLPNGPVFMSPDRLLHAFSREVIERRPEEFKIRCLESLKRCYPIEFNPFYAGFGNRPSDVNSYAAVGVPSVRVFIINPSGTVSTSNITDKKTYSHLAQLCAQVFPPNRNHAGKTRNEFFF